MTCLEVAVLEECCCLKQAVGGFASHSYSILVIDDKPNSSTDTDDTDGKDPDN